MVRRSAGLASFAAAANAQAQQTLPAAPPPAKVQELIKILDDPEIRAWLQTKSEPAAADAGPTTLEQISRWEALTRDRFASIFAAAHRVGSETASAATIVIEKVNQGRRGAVIGLIALLIDVLPIDHSPKKGPAFNATLPDLAIAKACLAARKRRSPRSGCAAGAR